MEGERAFVQDLNTLEGKQMLTNDNLSIAYKYSLGGGYRKSNSWEPLGPVGYYDTFGPELSFGQTLQGKLSSNIAIAKFTHSGSQIVDWTPKGAMAKSRHCLPAFHFLHPHGIKGAPGQGAYSRPNRGFLSSG